MKTSESVKSNVKSAVKDSMNGASKNAEHFLYEAEKTIEELSDSVGVAAEKIKESSSKLAKQSMDFVKRYPVQTALGVAAVGLVAGYLLIRPFRAKSDN